MLYNRLFSVSVGEPGGEGVAFTDLRATFNIERTLGSTANTIEASFYNLAPTTRAKFENTANRIILQAGYAFEGLKVLAIGDIMRASSTIEPPTVMTNVEAKDGGRALREARASVSYEAGTSAQTIFDQLVEMLEVDSVEISADLTGAFRQGWSFVGPVREGIDKLAARFGFDWSVQNNTIQVTPRREATQREAVFLTPMTGLIGSPTRLEDIRTDLEGDKEQPGVQITCLLNPAIVPGDPVVLQSASFPRSNYRVMRVVHRGDTHGNEWQSVIEAVEATEAEATA